MHQKNPRVEIAAVSIKNNNTAILFLITELVL
jgi:hypothetical protein